MKFCHKSLLFLVIFLPFVYNSTAEGLVTILTEWGEKLDVNNVLKEYPRPQFVRNSYLNLNGPWSYSLTDENTTPDYSEQIIVPFSIESPLSGVENKSLQPGLILWYKKIVDLTQISNAGKFILHFGAVDQFTEVFVNDRKVGEHDGGYTSFSFDITEFLGSDLKKVKLVVKVIDNFSKDGAAIGKQGNPRGGIWYVQTGGIWQTVWIESVPSTFIKDVKITPDYDLHRVSFFLSVTGDQKLSGTVKILTQRKI